MTARSSYKTDHSQKLHRHVVLRLSQNASTGRGTPAPGPSPEALYPEGSRINNLALDNAQFSETVIKSAPQLVDLRSPNTFGMTSLTPEYIARKPRMPVAGGRTVSSP